MPWTLTPANSDLPRGCRGASIAAASSAREAQIPCLATDPSATKLSSHRHRAFTLLETLLTLALLLVVVTLCGGFAFEARRTRNAVLEEVDGIAAARLFMERLTSDLRCVAVDPGVPFEGGPQGLRFATASLPPLNVWSAASFQGDPPPAPVQDVRVIEYRLLYDEALDKSRAVAMQRRVTPTMLPADPEQPPLGEAQSEHLCFLACRYWDGAQWLPEWRDVRPPLAVEIQLGRQPLPPEAQAIDYPFETYRRLIALSAGRPPALPDEDQDAALAPPEVEP